MNNIKKIESRDGRVYWIEVGDKLYENRMLAGSWQGGNWNFAKTILKKYRRCLDIGGNMACSAVLYAELFDQVESFEPCKLNQDLWKLTIRDNGVKNCNLHTVALGECDKTTTIVLHENNGGHNHLDNSNRPRWTGKKWTPRTPKPRKRATETVNVTTLDSYGFTDVDFMKLDIEGYEYFALQGAIETIKQNRPLMQIEIRANQCRKFGYWAEDMIEWIRNLDYTVISKKRGRLYGKFNSCRNELLYDGTYYKGEMDLFFQATETLEDDPRYNLFEQQ